MFGDEQISCTCGWHAKASKAKVLRILPFTWVFSTNELWKAPVICAVKASRPMPWALGFWETVV